MAMTQDVLQQAYASMLHDRRRTVLTIMGMAWGIATVVLLLAYGNGFGVAIENIFATYGGHILGVFPGRTSMQAGGNKAGTDIRFTMDDIERLTVNVSQITKISPEAGKTMTSTYETRSLTEYVRGDWPQIQDIYNLEMQQGRWYTAEEMVQKARVAVLGSEAKEKLFSGRHAIGERIRINGISFEVVGVIAPKMQEGDNNINRIINIPFTTMGELMDTHYLSGIWMMYESPDYEGVERTVRTTLGQQYGFNPEDKRAVYSANLVKQLREFQILTMGLKLLLAFIGTLTLGIGGVGLMNIMLVSVTQRTREIGVEKSLGATRRTILMQFMAEAMAITALGGAIGIVLSYVVSYSVGTLTLYSAIAKHGEAGDIRLAISPMSIAIAVGILGAVGVISGMVPAMKAASLDPIEALRYE
jgi:putative ABC transport system permease protein